MHINRYYLSLLILLGAAGFTSPASADSDEPEITISASPKSAWGDFKVGAPAEDEREPLWSKILLWVPNRVLDLIDVFRVDAGAGLAFGAVARVTKYGQVGIRTIAPLSVRVGDFGRKAPVLLEHSSEMGIGPLYLESKDREVCTLEVGAGADLILGLYGGICFDELADFAGGLFFIDFKKDDLKG